MKTCKDNIFFEAKTAGEYPKNWFVVPALDVGRYLKQNYVPLSEFEVFKQKTKQAIDSVFEEYEKDLNGTNEHDQLNAAIALDAIQKIKKKLEVLE